MKKRILALLMSALMLSTGIQTVSAVKQTYESAATAVDGNLIVGGDFNSEADMKNWSAGSQKMRVVNNGSGGYLECSKIAVNYAGFTYTSPTNVPAGTYRFTCYLRTLYEGELTQLRILISDAGGQSTTLYAYPTSDSWLKVETDITLGAAFTSIKVLGGPNADYVQAYCVDGVSLVKVDAATATATTFGTPVSHDEIVASNNGSIAVIPMWDPEEEAQYEVEGIVINQDADGFVGGLGGNITRETIENYAKKFEGSHVKDYMICVNNTNATFMSDTWTNLDDKYHQTVENDQAVDYTNVGMAKAAHNAFHVLGLDYIDIWCETFPEIGINPWLSFRMNDAHDLSKKTSHLLSDYFHEHPEIRRIQSGVNNNTYYKNCQDYSHELVRTHMLDLINEALSKYDCYGIELDFQREIWLWDTGSEYAGLDILNGFMRNVENIVAKYEAEYGHEIKIGIRLASDIETNYDFGLDVVSWAKEGIIDMVSPCGRWSTTDNGTPVKQWVDVLSPYGVEVWAGIENNLIASGSGGGSHSYTTYTAAAANYLSQGADRVYLFNYYRGLGTAPGETDRVSTLDVEEASTLGITSNKGYWNVITTIGSYEKLMKTDRRMILSYNDTAELWSNGNSQLPQSVNPNRTANIHIPMGDIPSGANVTLKLGFATVPTASEMPSVYVNGELCKHIGSEACEGGFTASMLQCFEIPAAALDEMYASVELKGAKAINSVNYAEVYIAAPENAEPPKKAETTPSDWATAEVNAATEADIVPKALKRNYTDKITRSEFCTLIMTMINKVSGVESSRELLTKYGIEYVDSFTDTDSADVVAASLMGIVNGRGNGIFDPHSGITRQEAAKMLASASVLLGIKAGTAPEFADIDKAASWAVDSVKTTASIVSKSGKNVMGGVGSGMFDPLGAYTKEQSILTVYRLYDSITGDVELNVATDILVTAAENTAAPVPTVPEGTSGIVIRANSDEVDVNRLKNTDVTDIVLTIGEKDPTAVIKGLRSVGIKVYVSVSADNAVNEAVSVIGKYSIDGIEVDFIGTDVTKRAMNDSYGALETNTDMLEKLEAKIAESGKKIKIAVRVAAEVLDSYELGLNVTEWARKGLIDRVSPSPIEVTDADIPVRLWFTLLEGYGVEVVPFIGNVIKVTESSVQMAHTPETIAAEAGAMLYQGATKVGIGYSTVDDASLTVIGTYAKLKTADRRFVTAYSDTAAPWLPSDEQQPLNMTTGSTGTAKVNIGEIGDDQNVTVRIAYSGAGIHGDFVFNVFANSEKCTHIGDSKEADPVTGYKFCTFSVPKEALGEGQLVLEFWAKGNVINIGYFDVVVE